MPETIRCGICGKRMRVKNFGDMMNKLRRHRKKYHPKAFRESAERSVRTRRSARKGRR